MRKIVFIAAILIANFAQSQQKRLTLDDAVLKQRTDLAPKNLRNAKWIPNSESFSYQSDDMKTLLKQSVSNGEPKTILTIADLGKLLSLEKDLNHFYGLKWIDENNFIINQGEKFYSVNLKLKTGKLISTIKEGAANIDFNLKSKNIAYTIGKSLFVNSMNKNEQVIKRDHEEIVVGQAIARFEFGISKGTFWSPKGDVLAFYEKDEIEVANYPLLDLSSTPANLNNIKYPMAGQKSEIAKVGVYNVATKQVVYMKTVKAKDDYLTNLSWSNDGKYILIAEVNRGQNHMKLNKYNATTGELIKTLFEEKNDKWVEPENPAYFINDKEFVWMSERDGFMNLYKYDINGKLISQLTKNKWVTNSVLGLDNSKNNLITTGTGANPIDMNTFSVNLSTGKQSQITRVSAVHSTSLSGNGKYILDIYSNLTTPREIQILALNGEVKRTVLKADNPLLGYNISKPEIETIKSADGTTDLYTRIIKPSNFNPAKKYPVLVYVYGGPHAQMITNRWLAGASMWMYYQAERGYIIYTVDNRGSKGRGFAFESVIHRNLGDAEMADQLKGVDYLKSLAYVNPNRIAVHGWSFGGFMTTSLMLRNPGVFTTGVAGGPVTDWKFYEAMYGERYMDTPEENETGYKKARVHEYVKDLKGDLLLIHGTVDDVVVPQHNYTLLQSFVDEGMQVDFFPYAMHPHNVRGKDRVHLMRKVLTYVEENNRMKTGKGRMQGGMRGGSQMLTPEQRQKLMKLPKEERAKARMKIMEENKK